MSVRTTVETKELLRFMSKHFGQQSRFLYPNPQAIIECGTFEFLDWVREQTGMSEDDVNAMLDEVAQRPSEATGDTGHCSNCDELPAVLCRPCVRQQIEEAVDSYIDDKGHGHCQGCIRAGGARKCPGVEGGERVSAEAIPDEDPSRPPLTHVAIRFRDQIWSLPRPYRHHHVIRLIIWATDNFGAQDVSHVDAYDDDQGFLDASGRYLNRKQAEVSAWLNKQLKNDRLIGSVLTSEDLW